MSKYTIVDIHDSGLGWIVLSEASTANEALDNFKKLDNGMAIAVLEGHHPSLVKTNLFPGSPVELEKE